MNTSITGPGPNRLTISGNNSFGVLVFANGTTNTISGLTIANGRVTNYLNGAGIFNAGTLMVSNCAVVSNQNLGGFGGGIYNTGDLVIAASTLANNEVIGEGGGDAGSVTNSFPYPGIGPIAGGGGGAGLGGALFTGGGSAMIINTVFSGNGATGGNGGGSSGSTTSAGQGGGLNGGASGSRGVYATPGGFGGGGGGGSDAPWPSRLCFCINTTGAGGGFGGGGGGGVDDGLCCGGSPGGKGGIAGGNGGPGGGGGGGGGVGGAVFVTGGSVGFINVTFAGNQASGGLGGVLWLNGSSTGTNGSGLGPDLFVYQGRATTNTSLSVATQGSGTVVRQPDKPLYALGEGVSLTAAPASWFAFTGWGDGGTNEARVVSIGSANSYTAIFSPTTAVETLSFGGVSRIAPMGMPAVLVNGQLFTGSALTSLRSVRIEFSTSFPNGKIFFTLDGTAPSRSSLRYGTSLNLGRSGTLRVIAYSADYSTSWENTPIDFTFITAFLLETTGGGGVIRRLPAASLYLRDSLVTVAAEAAPGWEFLQWLGDLQGTNSIGVLVMNRDRGVGAVFGTSLGATVLGSGSVVQSPQAAVYPYGTSVRLTAVPLPGNYFVSWSNAASGMNNPLLFVITNPLPMVSCSFAALNAGQASLAVIPEGGGQVKVDPLANSYDIGQTVSLAAMPDEGQSFLSWTGGASGAANPLSLLLDGSKVVTANFTRRARLQVLRLEPESNYLNLRMRLTAEMGTRSVIQSSPDLQAWIPEMGVTNIFGVMDFAVSVPTNASPRFYRSVDTP